MMVNQDMPKLPGFATKGSTSVAQQRSHRKFTFTKNCWTSFHSPQMGSAPIFTMPPRGGSHWLFLPPEKKFLFFTGKYPAVQSE
jgi:hypothetical protein